MAKHKDKNPRLFVNNFKIFILFFEVIKNVLVETLDYLRVLGKYPIKTRIVFDLYAKVSMIL